MTLRGCFETPFLSGTPPRRTGGRLQPAFQSLGRNVDRKPQPVARPTLETWTSQRRIATASADRPASHGVVTPPHPGSALHITQSEYAAAAGPAPLGRDWLANDPVQLLQSTYHLGRADDRKSAVDLLIDEATALIKRREREMLEYIETNS